MLVPYSTYQVVACAPGLTVPLTVAEVGPIALTGPVIAVGATAIAAAPATTHTSAEAVKKPAIPRLLRIRRAFRVVVKTVLGEWKGSVRATLSAP